MALSRRQFMKATASGTVTAGFVGTAVTRAGVVEAEGRKTRLSGICDISRLQTNVPFFFSYPDSSSPCALIKLGRPVNAGEGPDHDLVAFSILCAHMGCPVTYEASLATFNCACHFSIFDAEKCGQMVCGQATQSLPRILLDYDAKSGEISAKGVDGLIYGRISNFLEV